MPIEYSANTPMPSVSPLPQLPLRNLRLLIVDDDELVRLSLRINAELAGAGVLEAENGRGLSDSVRAFRPDVVLCDRRLEREDGVELLHQLHAELGAACPKLILMTGSGAPPSTDDAIKTVLQKPFSSETLLAAIQQSVSEA